MPIINSGEFIALTFPVYIHFLTYKIHPHQFFEVFGYALGFSIYFCLRKLYQDPISSRFRWIVVACAMAGAALGARILYVLEDPRYSFNNVHRPEYLLGGKTIVGALIGGLIAVEAIKRHLGERHSTGDLFAVPLAMGIAMGRLGCFFTGLGDNTYGTRTFLPWGVDFGDGIHRHPTQLYEAFFLMALVPYLIKIMQVVARGGAQSTHFRPGDVFKFFMVSYMSFRLICDGIKPYPRILAGLGTLQWACVFVLLYYVRDILRWLNTPGKFLRKNLGIP